MIIVLMGVTGSGKTTVGQKLAQALGFVFYDGDDFHPATNKEKMGRGVPLTDEDRIPWLQTLHAEIEKWSDEKKNVILACSALKQKYRDLISDGIPIEWVYLKGDRETIRARIERRQGHFAGAPLLDSQFEALEEPVKALIVDVKLGPETLVHQIIGGLKGETNS